MKPYPATQYLACADWKIYAYGNGSALHKNQTERIKFGSGVALKGRCGLIQKTTFPLWLYVIGERLFYSVKKLICEI